METKNSYVLSKHNLLYILISRLSLTPVVLYSRGCIINGLNEIVPYKQSIILYETFLEYHNSISPSQFQYPRKKDFQNIIQRNIRF